MGKEVEVSKWTGYYWVRIKPGEDEEIGSWWSGPEEDHGQGPQPFDTYKEAETAATKAGFKVIPHKD